MKVSILGAGNVATHLALALFEQNIIIDAVYNRTASRASALAGRVSARYVTKMDQLPLDSDIYFISVSDEAVAEVASQVEWGARFVVHTSGTLSIDVLQPYAVNYGVLYPLQTFSMKQSVSFNNIPCFLEASSEESLAVLKKAASKLSQSVYVVDSEQRKQLHIAAVFACNFTNYFFTIAERILEKAHLPFEVLKPIITETVEKSQMLSPLEAQTGPAVRKDFNVMEMHLDYLNDHPQWKTIYEMLSREIMAEYNTSKDEKL